MAIRREAGKLISGKTVELKLKLPPGSVVRIRESGSDINTLEEIVQSGVYSCVLPHLQNCESFIDLGANIGLATLYFAGAFPGCRFFSVEPNRQTYELLNANLAPLIAAKRCRTMLAAVWCREAVLAGGSGEDPEHYSMFALQESPDVSGTETVRGIPMAELLKMSEFERVDCLKIDIEGAEVELFKGDVDWLSRIGCIAIEFHGDSRVTSDFDLIMRRYGFDVFDTQPHTVVAVKTSGQQSTHRI